MSVLIKGMEMPKAGNWKTIRVYYDGTCAEPNWQGDCKVMKGCEAVPVPDHGDLIDRDEIFMQLRKDFAVIERMASEARAMAKDYLDGEKTGMGKAMIRVYEHEAVISAERSEDDGNK